MKFLLQYVLTAVILGSVVWFGVPFVKALVGDRAVSDVAQGDAFATAAPAAGGAQSASPLVLTPSAAQGNRASSVPFPAAAPAPSAAQTAASTPAPAASPAPEPAEPPAPQYAPGFEPRQPDYSGPRYDWGILAVEAQAFSADGKPRVKLPGGTVVEKMSERQTKSGDTMFVCRIRNNRRWEEGFLFQASDVVQFQGPFAFAPKKPSDQIIAYYSKLDEREKRMTAIREEHLRKNPHFETYREAVRKYKDAQAESKELTARRDNATGAERSRLVRELETMRNQEPRLRAELEKAEIAYKQWKDVHGDGSEQVSADREVLRLDKEIEDLYYEVADMIPGN